MRNVTHASLTLLLGLSLSAPALAQTPAPATPPGPVQVDRYVVGQARPPEVPGAPMRDLTLEQVIDIALENNVELKVARMQPLTFDYQLQQFRATFSPTLTSSYSYSNSSRVSENTTEGVARVTSLSQNFNGGIRQTLPWFGSSYQANFTNSRSSDNALSTRITPRYNSSMRLSFDMPLLAGFKVDQNRNRLKTLPIQRQVEELRLQSTIENTRNSVRTSYWALKSAVEAIEIQRRALALAQRTLDDQRVRVEIGVLAPIETVQQEAAVASAEQSLLAAEIAWRNAELNLKRLLIGDRSDEINRVTINPVDQPVFGQPSVNVEAAIQTAIENRLDLTQQRRDLDVSRMNLQITKDQLKPNLTFSSGYTLQGTAGTTRIFQGGQIVDEIPGGYFDALRAIAGFDTPAWNLGFNFSYPIGMRQAKASYATAVLNLEQAELRLKAQELEAVNQVTDAGLNVESLYKQLLAAQKTREAQEQNATAAQTRLDVGMATNFEVVQAQQQLTNARLNELRAMINYVNAIANFERVQRVGR
jgi:outer membrane protein TolC